MNSELIITAPRDIRAIAKDMSLWRIDRRTLSVRMPGLGEDANEDLRRRIALHYGACGCHQGRVAGFASVGLYALLLISGVISVQALGIWRVVLLYFAISFVVMFIGKLIGLNNARSALRRLADELDVSVGAIAPQEA